MSHRHYIFTKRCFILTKGCFRKMKQRFIFTKGCFISGKQYVVGIIRIIYDFLWRFEPVLLEWAGMRC
ncbi:MAG: hypothetical protein LBL74_05310 [Bacteroidales bacterium]|nr:hypothetical protein [Bacteroidales bacterium]